MNAIFIAAQLVFAYIVTHVILIPVRIVKKIIKHSASIGYPVFIPVALIVFIGCFIYTTRDIDFRYYPWAEIGFGLLFLLVITGVVAYLLMLVIRIIRKIFGKGKKLSASAYEAAFFFSLFVITVFSLPMNPETPRMMLSEALSLGSAYKIPVTEFYAANHRYPDNAELKSFGTPLEGKYVKNITIDEDGRIVATMKSSMYKSISGKSFILTPHDGGKTWDCGGPDIPNKYLPRICRKR